MTKHENPIGDAIREFLLAVEDLDYLTRVECSEEIVAAYWRRITEAIAAVHSVTPATPPDAGDLYATELCLIVGDILRIHELFRLQDTLPDLADYWEFDLLMRSVWREVVGVHHQGPGFSGGFWEIMTLREAIGTVARYTLKLTELPISGVPAKRIRRTEKLLFDAWQEEVRRIDGLMGANIDRWIYPRLGTNPDQWTSRLNRVLSQLRNSFRGVPSPDSHITQPVNFDQVEIVLPLRSQLEELADDLSQLRFDSENKPSAKDETEERNSLRLTADIDNASVTLDGKPYRVSKYSAIYLQALIDSGGKIVSGTHISGQYPEFPSDKITRCRERLPKGIQDLIESSQGSGSCLKPEAWQKSQS